MSLIKEMQPGKLYRFKHDRNSRVWNATYLHREPRLGADQIGKMDDGELFLYLETLPTDTPQWTMVHLIYRDKAAYIFLFQYSVTFNPNNFFEAT